MKRVSWNHLIFLIPFFVLPGAKDPAIAQDAGAIRPKRSDFHASSFVSPMDSLVKIVSSDERSLLIKITTPAPKVEPAFGDGRRFSKISIPGYAHTSEPGKPQVPVRGFYIALPEAGEISAQLVKSTSTLLTDMELYPAPRWSVRETQEGMLYTAEEFVIDQEVYSSRQEHPGRVVEVGSIGYMREVRVVPIRIFPAQYRPADKTLTFHQTIWIRVDLRGGIFPPLEGTSPPPADKGAPFEAIYRNTIINYTPAFLPQREDEGEEHLENLNRPRRQRYKLQVEVDGLYELSYEELAEAGFDLTVDPRRISVYGRGVEIPILVPGEEDGSFDPFDCVLFYGERNDGKCSRYNVYWLSVEEGFGLRMEERDVSPIHPLPVPTRFWETLHFEEDTVYRADLYGEDGEDRWFWEVDVHAGSDRTYTISVPAVSDTAAMASMKLCLRGKTNTVQQPDHHTEVNLNDCCIADLLWDGMVEESFTFSFLQSLMLDGENQLELRFLDDTGASVDISYVNWFDISYWRDLVAQENELRFTDPDPGPNQFEIGGFSQDQMDLFDITDPQAPIRLQGYEVVARSPTHTLVYEDDGDDVEYLMLTRSRRKNPIEIAEDFPSNLRSPHNRADYIIITYRKFPSSIEPLKELREAEGLDVTVAIIDDVYDEFSDGNADPRAIRDFLSYAFHQWRKPAPSYVLLVGDASYDCRENIPNGNVNYVPTHLFVQQSTYNGKVVYLEICSDDWFGYLEGDDFLPEMLIGRMSAQRSYQVIEMVEKILQHETTLPDGDWRQRVLLVADDPDEGGDFEGACEHFAREYIVPAGFDTVKVYASQCQDDVPCREQIVDAIDSGCVIVNYVGHGSVPSWAGQPQMFSSDRVPMLNNPGRYPLVVSFTCLNGFFHHASTAPNKRSLSEVFAQAPLKGSCASWAMSGWDYTWTSEILGSRMYEALLVDEVYTVGSALYQAKARYLADVPSIWDQAVMMILLGDPALEMGFPGRPDLLPGDIHLQSTHPLVSRQDTVVVTIHNAGREDVENVTALLWFGHPDSADAESIAEETISWLPSGGQSICRAVWETPDEPGTYWLFVQVDPDDEVVESNEGNNLRGNEIHVHRDAIEIGDVMRPNRR